MNWNIRRRYLGRLLFLKMKFALSSSVATVIDYFLYLGLVSFGIHPVSSNLISASTGFLVNFILQGTFIFSINRKFHHSLILSAAFSFVGIGVSTVLIWVLIKIPFFAVHQYFTKLLVVGLIFFYNFYTKRFAFEGRFLEHTDKMIESIGSGHQVNQGQ